MLNSSKHQLLLGAHTSAAGGVQNALYEGQKIGATTVQLFTANQRQWNSKPIAPEVVEKWRIAKIETGLSNIMSHDSYLINLGAPDPLILQKSRIAFQQEIERCHQLEITYLNFHPGAALKDDPQECLDRIVESLLAFSELLSLGSTRLLLETTAGQGSTVGKTYEEIAYILDRTKHKLPMGVCIDTCHIFVAGYDIRTPEALDLNLDEFESIIGLKNLYAFHLNDSKKGLGSRVDRHMPLGEGSIGMDCFKALMTNPRTCNIPKYLETPDGPELWEKEIKLLKSFADGSYESRSRSEDR